MTRTSEQNNLSVVWKLMAIVFAFALIAFVVRLYLLASDIDNSFTENAAFISELESDSNLTELVGFVVGFAPLYRPMRSGLDGYKDTRSGTILELDNGVTVAVGESFDSLSSGVELRKAKHKFKDTVVYCLNGKRFCCSFERKINIM